jgi:putative tryptophan/tyrosine transport system substrate-binding protein
VKRKSFRRLREFQFGNLKSRIQKRQRRLKWGGLVALGVTFALLGGVAQAQQRANAPRIGYLSPSSASVSASNREVFRDGLRQLGYVEEKNITIESRYADGKDERLTGLAAELVRLKVDVIVTHSTPAIRAVQRATTSIPIIMANVGDPIAQGFVASFAHPGGNITGFTNLSPDLSTKRLEVLKEVSPKILRVAVFQNAVQHGPAVKEVETAAKAFSVQLQILEVRGPADLDAAFEAAARDRADALVTLPNPLLRQDNGPRRRIVDFTLSRRIPSMYEGSDYVEAGGLMSYGLDDKDNFRRAAAYVDKILKGSKPADLPVQQPMKFEFVINLKAAKQIGVTIAPSVLARADRVIR